MASILGTAGDDRLTSAATNDSIWGGASGQDTVVFSGSLSDYSVKANSDGSHTITDLRAGSPDGSDKVRSVELFEFADQTVTLATLLETARRAIVGTDAGDSLSGSIHDDIFEGGGGVDHIWGAAGEDTAVYSGSIYDYSITENENGSYIVRDLRPGSPDGVDTVRDIEKFRFSDGEVSLDSFVETSMANARNTLIDGAGDDVLRGGNGDDVFHASAGDDTIWGGMDGEDLIVYDGAAADYGVAQSGNGSYYIYDKRPGAPDGVDRVRGIDVVQFSDGAMSFADFVAAHAKDGGFNLNGTSGDDMLQGAELDDVFTPGAGLDRIWGGVGGDDTVVLSGNFDDYLVTDAGDGMITILDMRADSPDGTNVVRGVEHFAFADQTVALEDIFTGAPTVDKAIGRTLTGSAADDAFVGAHTDSLYDAHTNDLMIGNAGADHLKGGYGDDVIYGDEVDPDPIVPEYTSNPDSSLPRFSFAPGLYQTIEGQVKKLNPATGAYENLGPDHSNLNAAAMNMADGYAYAIGTDKAWKGHLLRIGSNGEIEDLGGGFPSSFAGAFGPDGMFYIRTANNKMTRIDVQTLEQEKLTFSTPNLPTVHDLVFVGDKAYGVSPLGVLVAYDMATLTATADVVDGLPVNEGAFGALWTASDGGLYVSHNKTGAIYGVSGIENGSPAASYLAPGQATGTNDGFSFGGMPLPGDLLVDGSDHLDGGAGDDALYGGQGADTLVGGLGADHLDGGVGVDVADYSRATRGVVLSLVNGGTEGEAAGDTFTDVENVIGTDFGDVISGDDNQNYLRGAGGDDAIYGLGSDDTLSGDSGADHLDGGDGFDTVTYIHDEQGVTINLTTGVGSGGDAEGDTFASIEAVHGSMTGDDVITGAGADETLRGFGGDDWLYGEGGDDLLIGGEGVDWIEGGDGADKLVGDSGNDTLIGGAGDDQLLGGAGDDVFTGGAGSDSIWGSIGQDLAIFEGNYADYTLTLVADEGKSAKAGYDHDFYYVVENTVTGDIDRVRDIETLQFDDGAYTVVDSLFHAA